MLYKHYKGGLYRDIGEGIHTETNEKLVFYMSVETGKLFARPLEMFHGLVNLENGSVVPRYYELDEIE